MIQKVDWEKTITNRRSIRSYEMRPVEETEMAMLKHFISEMKVPFKHDVTLKMFKANTNKKLYSVFNSPPDGVAFLSSTDICSVSKTGFVGEMLILYATSLGLGTCWFEFYLVAELESIMPHLEKNPKSQYPKYGSRKELMEGDSVICISPIGYWQRQGLRLTDRITERFMSNRRKPLAQLLEGDIDEVNLPKDLIYALELARKAPSAKNSQPWRFNVSSNFKTITIALPIDKKETKLLYPDIDIGICACHFWLGLKMRNIECEVSLKEEEGRAVWRFEIG